MLDFDDFKTNQLKRYRKDLTTMSSEPLSPRSRKEVSSQTKAVDKELETRNESGAQINGQIQYGTVDSEYVKLIHNCQAIGPAIKERIAKKYLPEADRTRVNFIRSNNAKALLNSSLSTAKEKDKVIQASLTKAIQNIDGLIKAGEHNEAAQVIKENLRLCNLGINLGTYPEEEYKLLIMLGDSYLGRRPRAKELALSGRIGVSRL